MSVSVRTEGGGSPPRHAGEPDVGSGFLGAEYTRQDALFPALSCFW
jgi:hypothetical protein